MRSLSCCLSLPWAPCMRLGRTAEPSGSQFPFPRADTTACPLIHPLSSASTFGNSGVFAWPPWWDLPHPNSLCAAPFGALKQRWFAPLCVHLGRDTRVCPRVWVIMRPSGRRAKFWAAEEAGTKQMEAERNYLSQRST